jgi:hypothetical protein
MPVGLGIVAIVVLAMGVKRCLFRRTKFELSYYSPASVVPHASRITVMSSEFNCRRDPNLTVTIPCDREQDKIMHLKRWWKTFPSLRSKPFDVSQID